MTPKEKMEFLYPGKVVKLKSLSMAEDKHPHIIKTMEPYFGSEVTINRVINSETGIFTIREFGNNWHVDWIENKHFIRLPEELFEME